ncbi:MAG: DUF302 domain-containing protein [Ornithinimicrobium sp.]|uniref:DUF302 domain-containing protein n=1 Tax=Ornithinimicrobium sp. TaxID=1977084 RepID=UPI0026E0CA97|nr:DUF302 domain-containing protein [Ornithinimicrobium sp.]MDO5739312.1 DUF302 domain-containing protein [Ornithinimicrobium sp.]
MRSTAMEHAITVTTDLSFDAALQATRERLADEGFGILSEIDLAATLKAKIGADMPPQVILGACRPPLAYAAVLAEPSIGVFLPCNVVVRVDDAGRTVVEAMNPDFMTQIASGETLAEVAKDAKERITRALDAIAAASV